MSIPSTLISCFIGLVSCGYMSSLIVNSLWLIAVDPHRGGSISLRPHVPTAASLLGIVTRRAVPRMIHRILSPPLFTVGQRPFLCPCLIGGGTIRKERDKIGRASCRERV